MSENISKHRSGVLFALIFAASHAAWILFVVSGISRSAVNVVARTNFVEPEDTVDFDLSLTAGGLTIASVAGYLMGGLFAILWNRGSETGDSGSVEILGGLQVHIVV